MYIIIICILALAVIILTTLLLLNKTNGFQQTHDIISGVQEILDNKGFCTKRIVIVNKNLIAAVNNDCTKLVLITGYNSVTKQYQEFLDILTFAILDMTKNKFSIKLDFKKRGVPQSLTINPVSKDAINFFYKINQTIGLKKIQEKYPQDNFSISSSDDWDCNYIWGYDFYKTSFAYGKMKEKNPIIYRINLRKEHFVIDTKFNHFEAPIMGIAQQLYIYEKNFLIDLHNSLFQSIKQKTTSITDNHIYYDSYNEIIYLSNGSTSLQSVIIDEVDEISYEGNKIYFSLLEDKRTMSFTADNDVLLEFIQFITNYNLRKIAKSFNSKIDKLINTTENTKFIFDFTRSRVIYCANLNKLRHFSYIIYSFDELASASVIKNSNNCFVRIYTKEAQIIDVTCSKYEVAEYIVAQINIIVDDKE